MTILARFLDPSRVSLKICGVRTRDDAAMLADLGVDALGVNFWPHSKRYLDPAHAGWLHDFEGRILRVGVWVNPPADEPLRWFREGLVDGVQLHGDESPDEVRSWCEAGIPCIKAIGADRADDLLRADRYGATALLLDAPAPGTYGGTGNTFDWSVAKECKLRHPQLPLILAGGITPANAAKAVAVVAPCALDVASGAEAAPGVKDPTKVRALLSAIGC
jgi:phosphoribosylanthranilate isomerase